MAKQSRPGGDKRRRRRASALELAFAESLRRTAMEKVELALAGKVICGQCGATLETYAEKCAADLTESCEGFNAIEAARAAAE